MRKKRFARIFSLAILCLAATACTISYKFNAASIDYTKISTITINDFPNQAAMVYPPLSQLFTETMKDLYNRKTRLQQVQQNGDLELEGEITGYDLAPTAVNEDAWASRTRFTITIRVRYTNRKEDEKDFEQSFSAYREFDANRMLTDVQDELIKDISDEIADQIFNATVANW
jgi:hypothetical protein